MGSRRKESWSQNNQRREEKNTNYYNTKTISIGKYEFSEVHKRTDKDKNVGNKDKGGKRG